MAETVNIAVPVEWASEVYAFVAQLAAREYGPGAVAHTRDRTGSPEPGVELSASLVEQMYRESLRPHKQLMLYLAEHPDQWLSTSQIAADLGLEKGPKALAGMLGAFRRRSKNRYHGLTPWESHWIPETEHSEHRMTQAVADVLVGLADAEQAAVEARRQSKVVQLQDGSAR